jgi:hypothetical protein
MVVNGEKGRMWNLTTPVTRLKNQPSIFPGTKHRHVLVGILSRIRKITYSILGLEAAISAEVIRGFPRFSHASAVLKQTTSTFFNILVISHGGSTSCSVEEASSNGVRNLFH